MGWTYEVEAWQQVSPRHKEVNRQFEYVAVYTGESLFAAIKAMREAKKNSGCVRLSWR